MSHEIRRSIRHQLLQIVLSETASESLLLGKVIGVVQGSEVGDALFCFVPRIRIDYLDAIARGEGIKKIQQPDLMILVQTSSGFAMLEYPFDDQETRGEGEGLFKFMEKRRAIEGGIRKDRIEFFDAHACDAQQFGYFCNGIAADGQ